MPKFVSALPQVSHARMGTLGCNASQCHTCCGLAAFGAILKCIPTAPRGAPAGFGWRCIFVDVVVLVRGWGPHF